jgi:hypothetical protein
VEKQRHGHSHNYGNDRASVENQIYRRPNGQNGIALVLQSASAEVQRGIGHDGDYDAVQPMKRCQGRLKVTAGLVGSGQNHHYCKGGQAKTCKCSQCANRLSGPKPGICCCLHGNSSGDGLAESSSVGERLFRQPPILKRAFSNVCNHRRPAESCYSQAKECLGWSGS